MNQQQYMKFMMKISASQDRASLEEIMRLIAKIPDSREKIDLANSAGMRYLQLKK